MIAKIALSTAEYFADKKVYSREAIEIYKYGFELLLSTILNIAGLFVISFFMGSILDAILFLAAFIPLRVTAGGYHANHHRSCFLTVNITFFFFAVLLKYMSIGFGLRYTIFAVITASIIIWLLSPVEAINKPLSEQKKRKVRTLSLIIASIDMSLVVAFAFMPNLSVNFITYFISGMLAASISLVAAKATKKPD